MSVATYNKEPWIATVYYIVDKDLNLYFLSSASSRHAQYIFKNENVACNIFDSHQKVTDKKVGVQIYGTCSALESVNEIEPILKMWHKLYPGSKCSDLRKIKNHEIDTRVFKVVPKRIKFFNEQLFPDKGAMEVDL